MNSSEIVNAYRSVGVELKESSGGRFTAKCPFHNENDASFVVYGDGSFHCFGCWTHGSIDYILKMGGSELVSTGNIDITSVNSTFISIGRIFSALDKIIKSMKIKEICALCKAYDIMDMEIIKFRYSSNVDEMDVVMGAREEIERVVKQYEGSRDG